MLSGLLGAPVAACAVGGAEDGTATGLPNGLPEDPDGSLVDVRAGGREGGARADGSDESSTEPPPPPPGPDGSSGDAGPDAPPTFACAQTVDFESGASGFTHQASDGYQNNTTWPFDSWAVGAAANGLGCRSGTSCWATGLTENYVQCQRAELRSPAIDLTTCAAAGTVKVVFQHAYAFWTGAYGGTTWFDGGIVEISGDNGATWVAAEGLPTSGTVKINPSQTSSYACYQTPFRVDGKAGFVGTAGWASAEFVVPTVLRTSQFAIRFSYGSGVSFKTTSPATSKLHTAAGWHIDDVQITAQ